MESEFNLGAFYSERASRFALRVAEMSDTYAVDSKRPRAVPITLNDIHQLFWLHLKEASEILMCQEADAKHKALSAIHDIQREVSRLNDTSKHYFNKSQSLQQQILSLEIQLNKIPHIVRRFFA